MSIIKGINQSNGLPVNGLSVYASTREEMLSTLRNEFDALLDEKGAALCPESCCFGINSGEGKCCCVGNNVGFSIDRYLVPSKEEMESWSNGSPELLKSAGLFTFRRSSQTSNHNPFPQQQVYLVYK